MSAVGFAPLPSKDSELEKLREACKRLNFAIRAIKDAQTSLTQLNIGEAKKRMGGNEPAPTPAPAPAAPNTSKIRQFRPSTDNE